MTCSYKVVSIGDLCNDAHRRRLFNDIILTFLIAYPWRGGPEHRFFPVQVKLIITPVAPGALPQSSLGVEVVVVVAVVGGGTYAVTEVENIVTSSPD
jgi:hypothetical protein